MPPRIRASGVLVNVKLLLDENISPRVAEDGSKRSEDVPRPQSLPLPDDPDRLEIEEVLRAPRRSLGALQIIQRHDLDLAPEERHRDRPRRQVLVAADARHLAEDIQVTSVRPQGEVEARADRRS